MITPTIESRPGSALLRAFSLSARFGWLPSSRWRRSSESLELSARYQATAAVVFVAIVATALVFVYPHHPYSRFGPANYVTLTRALQVALLSGLLGEPTSRAAAWLPPPVSGMVPLLDGVDGWLARRTRDQSYLRALRHGDRCAARAGAVGPRLALRQGRRVGMARRTAAYIRRRRMAPALAGASAAADAARQGSMRVLHITALVRD